MKLYKYIGLDSCADDFSIKKNRIIDIIKEKKIYLSTYCQLNDPFEGTFRSDKTIYKDKGGNIVINDNKPVDSNSSDRILCLTEDCESILMWAHYANSFKGICLEFDINEPPKIEKVKYVKDFGDNFSFDPLVKSIEWEYEKEYRYISSTSDTYVTFDELGVELTKVIFGVKVNSDFLKDVVKELGGSSKIGLSYLCHEDGCKVRVKNYAAITSNNFIHSLPFFNLE
ncbi:DUF2971 domain-containing protein [Halobacteriovorax sp. RT-1-4]|uniref:DUF2971 domain-containing protein n=1 Tax=unclassified Halobacteriovorax TaxID=2639665 RepID=UPI00399A34CA